MAAKDDLLGRGRRSSRRGLWLLPIMILAAAAGAGAGLLLIDVFRHKEEAKHPFFQVMAIDDSVEDPAEWGKNFPHQYDVYLCTADQVRTRYGGSETIPRTPTKVDPRTVVAQSRLEEDPRLKTI